MKPSVKAKLRDRAARANLDSPEEAAIVQNKLAAMPESRLEVIADDIKAEWGKGIESQFAIGRLLSEAQSMFPGGQAAGESKGVTGQMLYERWFKGQQFPFKRATAYHLRIGYEREAEVRELIATRVAAGGTDIGVTTAVVLLQRRQQPAIPAVGEVNPLTPVDRAYAALREARNRILEPNEDGESTINAFENMHIDDLAASAGFLQELVAAYQAAKGKRTRV